MVVLVVLTVIAGLLLSLAIYVGWAEGHQTFPASPFEESPAERAEDLAERGESLRRPNLVDIPDRPYYDDIWSVEEVEESERHGKQSEPEAEEAEPEESEPEAEEAEPEGDESHPVARRVSEAAKARQSWRTDEAAKARYLRGVSEAAQARESGSVRAQPDETPRSRNVRGQPDETPRSRNVRGQPDETRGLRRWVEENSESERPKPGPRA